MGKKLTLEYVKGFFEEQGCELLDEEYINSRAKMRYKCSCGDISTTRFKDFKRGSKCKKCGIEKSSEGNKLLYKDVKQYFKDHGCKLLEKEYIDNRTKMKYICSCGNISTIKFSEFKEGHRCRKCSGCEKYTLKYMKQFFLNRNCELLETEYKAVTEKMKFKCSCGNISQITFISFKRGCFCFKCGNLRRIEKRKFSFKYVDNYYEEQGCKLLEKEYINCRVKMRYRCKCGEIECVSFSYFQTVSECSKCRVKNYSGENHYRWIKDRKKLKEINYFKKRCRLMLRYSLRRTNQRKKDKTQNLLGYTFKKLQDHMYNHPNWKKVKDVAWNFDHIFPIKAFLDYGIRDISLINCLENLQPLSWEENARKNANYDEKEFEKWLKGKEYDF